MFYDTANVLTIKNELQSNDNNIFYFLDVDNNYNTMSNFQIVRSLILNFFISKGDFTNCQPDPNNEKLLCDDTSLLFKFSRVFASSYPSLLSENNWIVSLKLVTILFYLFYVFSGTIISLNAVQVSTLMLFIRIRKVGGFYKNVVKMVWQSLDDVV